jgi:hypothetical protein
LNEFYFLKIGGPYNIIVGDIAINIGRICEIRDKTKAVSMMVSIIEGFGGIGTYKLNSYLYKLELLRYIIKYYIMHSRGWSCDDNLF